MDGHEVFVLDRAEPEDRGCSFGNAGIIVPSHFVPLAAPGMVAMGLRMLPNRRSPFAFSTRPSLALLRWSYQFWRHCNPAHVERNAPLLLELNLRSRDLYTELQQRIGDFGLEAKGMVMLCESENALRHELLAATEAKRNGLRFDEMSRADAEASLGIAASVAGAIHYHDDAHLDPTRLMLVLREALRDRGVQFRFGSKVKGWRRTGAQVHAAVADEEFEADQFVLAAGVWSQALARELGVYLPIEAGKGYSVTLTDAVRRPKLPCILTESRVAITPMGSSLRVGGTMELGCVDERVSQPRVEGILGSVRTYLPDLSSGELERLPVWSGLRPCSPDGVPYIGRVPGAENVVAATGHAMMGVSLGAATGDLVAGLLRGEPERPQLSLSR
jgi:D-amino-acid dehydrogenase